ncbi:MAG TPA: UbiA family prenyltransferase, partial [Candidatus Sumerlaeota bacterium]|nr:UbiA family prenyltransferase [Candidatus Sumerlaeota bacterium]
MLLPLLESMRPRQWTKNLLLFAGVIFTRNLSNLVLLGRSIAGFALFCALSGAVYLVNDLKDVEADRLHPRKKNRPIASGRLSPGLAWSASVVISLIALVLSFLMGFHFGLCALVYLILVTLYSLHLKHYVIVDLMLVALGFVIRALAGIMVITVDEMHPEITSWFIACTLFLALFLALCKRRHELTLLTEGVLGHRRVLEEYSMDFLDQMVSVTTSATVISY